MSEAENVQQEVVSEAIGEPGAGKRKVDPGFRRNLTIIGGGLLVGAAVIIGAMAMFSGGGNKVREGSDIQVNNNTQKSTDGLTPAMREKVGRAQTAESIQAARMGESYIPPDVLPATPNEPMMTPAQQQRAFEAEARANADAVRLTNERNMLKLNAAQQMLQSTLQRPEVERVAIAAVAPSDARSVGAPAAPSATASDADVEGLVADMMEIFGGRLSSPVDTDASGFASAEITTGKLAGAYLIGQVKLVGEGVQFDFTGMRLNGVSYAINAFALDEKTSTTAVQGDLDRKLLQRYVFPVLMAYGGAYATAKAQVATTVTNLGGVGGTTGSTTGTTASDYYGVTRAVPTSAQARAAGVASAVSMGSRATSKLAAEPVRVSMPGGVAIGIMFREPVVAKAPAAGATTAGATARPR